MFTSFFRFTPKKKSNKSNQPFSFEKQKQQFDQDKSLLKKSVVNQIMERVKQHPEVPPFCLQATLQIPFKVLYDGTDYYVLSNIVLGEGGEGVVMAAAHFSEGKTPQWVAIKECFPANREIRDMVSLCMTNEEQFIGQYEDELKILYMDEYPAADYDVEPQELVNFFKDKKLPALLSSIKEIALSNAQKNKAIMDDLALDSSILVTNEFVYYAMPLLRGNDLLLLSGGTKEDATEFLENLASQIDRPNAQEKCGPFVTGYARVIGGILEQVSNFHKKNYLHRDIKPQNFMLLETGEIQLIDFGSSLSMDDKNPLAYSGTAGYKSPQQQWLAEHHDEPYHYSKADDIYSLGVTLNNNLHVQLLIDIIFELYPQELSAQFKGMQEALADLSDEDPELRIKAMSYLEEQYSHFIQLLELRQGLLLIHDDNLHHLIKHIDQYRVAYYESSKLIPLDEILLQIDGLKLPSQFVHGLLMSDASSEDIANNLLLIRQQFEKNPSIKAEEVVDMITQQEQPSISPSNI
ncbi:MULTISPECIES: protein kinase domain-containing protein [Legionella]|uniref:Serine/threonine-protein kinase n=1 Tax=Legionella drozanskii LLAP-1 TaxID=1212489 RepID=A0A0W0SQ50_9GAMM|nr:MULTISPECIES: protein kinase [Legionella]KTC85356.1 serine/threonine-protein kinase [Legionella drozanskii LLAP-1]PJE13984.1 MAG: hypothetical protein CK430_05815 [Legionella sp.]